MASTLTSPRSRTQIEAVVVPFAAAVRANSMRSSGSGCHRGRDLISEIGVDMSRFPTAGHLTSWAKFAPGVSESAGRRKGRGASGHGNRYLASVLGEIAVALGRTDTFLGERYRRIARRRGTNRATSRWGGRCWSWSGVCCPSPRPVSRTSGRISISAAVASNARKPVTSASSRHWVTESPSSPSPDPKPIDPGSVEDHPAPLRCAGCCRTPGYVRFSD